MVKVYCRFFAFMTIAASASLLVSGCSQKAVRTDEGAEKMVVEPVGQKAESVMDRQAPVAGMDESLDASPADTGAMNILEGRTTGPMLPIYFDFDQSNVRADQKTRIENNASYLKDSPQSKIVVEGNCDERGTNEYNMALGERRAVSAKKYLVNLGVTENRINTISYGEERPLNFGHDELAWSQNRRADFVEMR